MSDKIVPQRQCIDCLEYFPATLEYFKLDLAQKGCLSKRCLPCKKKHDNGYQREYNKRPDVKTKLAKIRKKQNEAEKAKRAVARAEKLRSKKEKTPFEIYCVGLVRRIRTKIMRFTYPERFRAYSHAYRTRKRNADGSHTKEEIKQLYKESKGLCWWCGKKIKGTYHVDHRVSLKKGGSNNVNNLCISCPKCNHKKGASLPYERMGRLL